MNKYYICLDIGGTKILGALFDQDKKIVSTVKKNALAEKGQDAMLEQICGVIDEISLQAEKGSIAAIGAGVPGIITDEGKIIYTPNIPLSDFNMKEYIQNKYNIPFFMDNDVNVGTVGEWKYGAGKGMKDVVGIFVGTGIGGGIVVGGKLHRGAGFSAGEVGHVVLNPEGPYCNCGSRGCLEAYSSKIAITKYIKSQIDRGRKSIITELDNGKSSTIKSSVLKKAVKEKDALAIEVLDRAAYYLAAGAASILNVLNPEILILGGGVIEALDKQIMPVFKRHLTGFTMPSVLDKTKIATAELGDDAIIYGAAALIEQSTKG